MCKGLGRLQSAIVASIREAERLGVHTVTFADIRNSTAMRNGGHIRPTFERSLKRAVKTLTERGDLVIVRGRGGRWSPYHFVRRETFLLSARSIGRGA
jgi:hypothetical protein